MSALHVIDNLEYARNFQETRAIITGCDVPRLAEAGLHLAGDIAYVLRGLIDEQGRAVLLLYLQAVLELQCQRCLVPFQQKFDLTERFVVLQSEAEVDAAELASTEHASAEFVAEESGGENGSATWLDQQEDYLVQAERFDVLALIEDTLLLAVPYAPRHPMDSCILPVSLAVDQGLADTARPNPFAVLASFKASKSEEN